MMTRRLYFLTPNIQSARQIVNELLLARVDDHHIHLLAKEGTSLEGLPEAGVLQRSDLVHGLELGIVVGGLTGFVTGLFGVLYAGLGIETGGMVVLGTALAGCTIGAWASTMIAVNVPNSRLRPFQKSIEQGKILFMVDVPSERVEDVSEMVHSHHPEVSVKGTEPSIPAFP